MGKRILLQLLVVFLFGMFSGLFSYLWAIPAFVFCIIICFISYYFKIQIRVLVILFITYSVFFAAGLLRSSYCIGVMENAYRYYENNESINFRGEIYKKDIRSEKHSYYIKNITIKNSDINVSRMLMYSDKKDYPLGAVIEGEAKVSPMRCALNEGGFDQKKYLASQGIYATVKDENIQVKEISKFHLRERLYRYRIKIADFYDANLPGEEGGILSAMVLGEKSELDDESKELFKRAGLSHILAISGLHLSVVGYGLYELLRRFGISFFSSGIISGVIVVIYGIITGSGVSMERALVMYIIMLLSKVVGRGYDILSALSFTAIIILFFNPFYIINAGFLMSFGVVFGISTVCIPLVNEYDNICKLRWESIRKKDIDKSFSPNAKETFFRAIITGMGIQLFSVPILAYFYNQVPLYVMFLNLILIPFMGVLLYSGIIAGITLVPVFLYISHIIIYAYEFFADVSTRLPLSTFIIKTPSLINIGIYYMILYLGVIICLKTGPDFRFIHLIRDGKLLKIIKKRNPKGYYRYKSLCMKIYKSTGVFIIVSCLLIVCILSPTWKEFEIDMLSVGQGDGIFVQSKEGINLFIDGGSSSQSNVGKYTILPFLKSKGIRQIHYWMISHLDKDHYNGLIEVMNEGYKVERILITKAAKDEEGSILNEIEALCKKSGSEIIYVKAGSRLGTKSLSMDILYPDYPTFVKGTNENSMVVMLSFEDFQCLFTGDLGSEQEKEIINSKIIKKIKKYGDIEVLKVGHHGSKNSTSKEWIEAINPNIAIISAGEKNRYGHPSKETIERLKEANVEYFCTIESGRIRVRYRNGKIEVEPFKKLSLYQD